MPNVCVCFLPADSQLLDDHWLNRAAAARAPRTPNNEPPKVHAELFFPESETKNSMKGHSCGIHYGGQVFMFPKQFSKNMWQFRSLSVTRQQYDKMLKFCRKQVGGGFNYFGYFTPCNVSANNRLSSMQKKQKWYCSELVATALYHGGILDSISEAALHPQCLFAAIEDVSYADCCRNLDNQILKL